MENKTNRRTGHYGLGTHLFNDGWQFAKQPLFTSYDEISRRPEAFVSVGLPHDWLIYQGTDLYENGTGWYRKKFLYHPGDGEIAFLRVEGVYMDSAVYVNGEKVMEWKYGYSTFEVPLEGHLKDGENEIMVSVNFQSPNSRWYSGAGIYRDVWLKVVNRTHLLSDGIYTVVKPAENDSWELEVRMEGIFCRDGEIRCTLTDRLSGKAVAGDGEEQTLLTVRAAAAREVQTLTEKAVVRGVTRWDVEHPHLYDLKAELFVNGSSVQTERYTIGFCEKKFLPDQGFLLNGRKVKLNGVCEHHDLGCLGAAYNHRAMERKLEILKQMGVNALRLTHNMFAPDVMELADSMGFLVISEAFDMWERPKNPYDYGRFFPEWYRKDVASWVRRDRNHPSLILWSIGNEIYDTHVSDRGQELTKMLMKEVRIHDPEENARITIGSNYMPWENAQKCADLVKVAGYNYAEKYYDEHHREHPDWIIYGSETGSTVQSRGIYRFPYSQSVLSDVDSQCSALGNSTTSWGARSSEACVVAERDHEFSCGQFLWTGFDYIGEPTPYHTRNSYFGQIDTAGFPKDSYYIYQAEWTDYRKKPMVHLFPYWDFNEGQLIDVRVCSNAPMVELFMNGRSQGTFEIDHAHGGEKELTGHWQLPYEPGEITAKAYDDQGNEIASETRHSFGEARKITWKVDRPVLKADGRDLAFIEIGMEDENGYPVENADSRVFVRVDGSGYLAGLDNGDSTDVEEYKTVSRRLFSGKLLAVVAAGSEAGEIRVEITSMGMEPAVFTLKTEECPRQDGIGEMPWKTDQETARAETEKYRNDIPVRALRIRTSRGTLLSPENKWTEAEAVICPENAGDRQVIWSIVDDAGIPSSLATVESDGRKAKITAVSDGEFRLRCMSKSGTGEIRIISEMNFSVTGFGKAYLDPYGFIAGGLYDYVKGTATNGNEHGVATSRDGETQVGFHSLDFGPFGSDEIELPIFALDSNDYEIQVYEGMPGEEGSELIGDLHYQKPSRWNVYQPETYRLKKRLKGVTSICFVLHAKIHLKGFSFTRQEKAYETLYAAQSDSLYGDSFRLEGDRVCGIGNNVTLEYTGMNMGEEGAAKLMICGYTPMEKNTIQIRFTSEEEEITRIVEFCHQEEEGVQEFELERVPGRWNVSFVFLPGSNFDFYWFRFVK